MKTQLKDKIRTYSFWTGVSATVVLIGQQISELFGFSFNSEIVSNIIMSVCGLLVALGVVTNVTLKNKGTKIEESMEIDESKNKTENDNDSQNDNIETTKE